MSEELLPLTDKQLVQYEAVINKIRESKKYKEFLEIDFFHFFLYK